MLEVTFLFFISTDQCVFGCLFSPVRLLVDCLDCRVIRPRRFLRANHARDFNLFSERVGSRSTGGVETARCVEAMP